MNFFSEVKLIVSNFTNITTSKQVFQMRFIR